MVNFNLSLITLISAISIYIDKFSLNRIKQNGVDKYFVILFQLYNIEKTDVQYSFFLC